jgi:lipopolysaccharide/colanic/teichoic acid biosynthesis glycosyltransferase
MLVLISGEDLKESTNGSLIDSLVTVFARTTRETDVLGWYERYAVLGLMMTEIDQTDPETINAVRLKITTALRNALPSEKFRSLTLRFCIFPQEVERLSGQRSNIQNEDGLWPLDFDHISGHIFKRSLDVVGSLFALMIFMPLFVIIGALVKLTSKGPILFCQKRVGLHGREFNFYKFRTMYTGNDPRIHQEYVAKLIEGGLKNTGGVYKIKDDPRVTKLGRLLRKTSLDELPQFFNVLKNDMSLVGPRPPLPYEFERYQAWHKRRVFELKPGLTGLWQIEGRSRTTFDEMVRMDLKYALQQSLWTDLKILMQTPGAMFSGKGAC